MDFFFSMFPAEMQDTVAIVLGILAAAVIYGVPTALVAKWKRRSPWAWGLIGTALACLIIGLIPFPLLYLLFATPGDDGSEASPAAKDLAQGAPYAYVGGGTGIAVDPARRIVRLKDRKTVMEYDFASVRQWRTVNQTGGEVLGVGAVSGTAAVGQNVRASHENRRASGLFLAVKDIDRPQWRIDMPRESLQQRWMEILNQTINNDRQGAV